jgi:hypothetical protein
MQPELGSAASGNGAALAPRQGGARALGALARGGGVAVALLLGIVAGIGWLYVLRGLGWLDVGPRVRDALPLLQLPGFDEQPLLRVAVAWVAAGAVAALPMARAGRLRRALIGWAAATALLLLASQASFALARNLRFGDVVWSRGPGFGPWLEGLLFAAGCALPGRIPGRRHRREGGDDRMVGGMGPAPAGRGPDRVL